MGYKDSGKTTAIVELTRLLCSRGLRVCVLKHIGGEHTLVDPSKDTGRFLGAGAFAVAALDRHTLALLYPGKGVEEAYGLLVSLSPHYVFVEGFATHRLFMDEEVRCVVCARTAQEAAQLVRTHGSRRVVCVTGVLARRSRKKQILGVPVLRVPEEAERLLGLLSG